MATVLPAQAALNSKLNRSRPTQKERKLIRQQQQQQQHLAGVDGDLGDALEHGLDTQERTLQPGAAAAASALALGARLDWLALTDSSKYRTVPVVFTADAA